MRRLGTALMGLGALVGSGAAVWVAMGLERPGLSWIVAVGLVKLTVVASFGLMAGGAMLLRIANRSDRAREIQRLVEEVQSEPMSSPGRTAMSEMRRPDG